MDFCPYCAALITSSDQTCPNCGANIQGFQLPIGATIGKYQIGRVLGQGGFGITYLAIDTVLQSEVAIKELFPNGSTRKNSSVNPPNTLGMNGFLEAKKRFLEEARLLTRFQHLGIVRVFEVFEANNTAYLVMEALKGETLGAKIAREQKLPETEVKTLALELCDALEIVHKAGLLHRDIKPDNIFLTQDARVVLVDFGSARSFRASQRTKHTQLITPGYAAPEQYASEAKFGPHTDIYGLAASLFHAVTGNPPQNAADRLIGSSSLELPSNVNPAFAQVLEQALAIKIQDRPKDVESFRQAINTIADIRQGKSESRVIQSDAQNVTPDISIHGEVLIAHGNTYLLREFSGIRVMAMDISTEISDSITLLLLVVGAFSTIFIYIAISSISENIVFALMLFVLVGISLPITRQRILYLKSTPSKREYRIHITLCGKSPKPDHTFHISTDQNEANLIANTISTTMKSLGVI
jgi:serine/threonine protein kinase